MSGKGEQFPGDAVERTSALAGYEVIDDGKAAKWGDLTLERAGEIMCAFIEKAERNLLDRERRLVEVRELLEQQRSGTVRLESETIKIHLLPVMRPEGKIWSVVIETNNLRQEEFRQLILKHLPER